MRNKIKIISIITISLVALFATYSFKQKELTRIPGIKGICVWCNGSGVCSTCLGAGKMTCPKCGGTGQGTEAQLNHGYGDDKNIITCPKCKGSGVIRCTDCNGTGICHHCNGTGKAPY